MAGRPYLDLEVNDFGNEDERRARIRKRVDEMEARASGSPSKAEYDSPKEDMSEELYTELVRASGNAFRKEYSGASLTDQEREKIQRIRDFEKRTKRRQIRENDVSGYNEDNEY